MISIIIKRTFYLIKNESTCNFETGTQVVHVADVKPVSAMPAQNSNFLNRNKLIVLNNLIVLVKINVAIMI